MDSIGNIGGNMRIPSSIPSTGFKKLEVTHEPKETFQRGSEGFEISNPLHVKQSFLKETPAGVYTGPEVKDPVVDLPKAEIKDPTSTIDYFKKPEREVTAFEGFYLAGGMEEDKPFFSGFDLNGPNTLEEGFITISGQSINNPKFIAQE